MDLLQHSVELIKEAADSTGARIAGPVPLPTHRKIYTVLRSPHVNKDSREQFETRLHQRLIDVKDLSAETVDKLMQLDIPAGVDVQVRPAAPQAEQQAACHGSWRCGGGGDGQRGCLRAVKHFGGVWQEASSRGRQMWKAEQVLFFGGWGLWSTLVAV